ncbi:MAG: alpha-L-fucosidase [Chitinophagaceae bacterium]
MKTRSIYFCFFLLLFSPFLLRAQDTSSYSPTQENLQARKWFEGARFGMFIHWGPATMLGMDMWAMNNRNIRVKDYKRFVQGFDPIYFNPKTVVDLARAAGMKYITLITRHHDGFSLWNSQASDYNIMHTAYDQDIVKMMAVECHQQGMKLFLYYSLLDWSRSDYYPLGRTGRGIVREGPHGNWNDYINFMKKQLTELLTQYGKIDGIWLDGYWDQVAWNDSTKTWGKPLVHWHMREIYDLIHQLQPWCLIGNNRHQNPLPGEDFQMFEKDLPGQNTTGFGGASVSTLPLETSQTINNSWGYNITDTQYKSVAQLIHLLVRTAGHGANLLLNIGPLPDGKIQSEFTTRLLAMGNWLTRYGPTIYGTQGGNIPSTSWGAITETPTRVYLHILRDQGPSLVVKNFPYQVMAANLFSDKSRVPFTLDKEHTLTLDLTGVKRGEWDTVIDLFVNKHPEKSFLSRFYR